MPTCSKRVLLSVGVVFAVSCLVAVRMSSAQSASKFRGTLTGVLTQSSSPVKTWVFFKDKDLNSPEARAAALECVASEYGPRAVERRRLRRSAPGLFDERDVPVVPSYVESVTKTGARLRVTSRWLNAVSVVATRTQLEAIADLPFVKSLQPVRRSRRIEPAATPIDEPGTRGPDRGWYGYAEDQLTQINVVALHGAGYTGQGVVIGVLDTGFERSHDAFNYPGHTLTVLAEYDFVDDDGDTSIETGDPYDQHSHGTMILSAIGGYDPDTFVGGAYNASFILAKTEDTTDEYPQEEDFYVAGLEFVETNGADMATSSLGYIDWYTQGDLDGLTAVTTIVVNTATQNGMVCCTAAGNEYHDSNPNTSHLIAPADALQVITCGAVDEYDNIADFSSDGPTADGRVKPEVLALGVSAIAVWPHDTYNYSYVDGTSIATPLVAAAVGCLLEAQPAWSVDKLRSQLFYTADYYVANQTYEPTYVRGYGILDAHAALTYADCNGNGIPDADDIANCGGSHWCSDANGNGIPDGCELNEATISAGDIYAPIGTLPAQDELPAP